MILKLNLQLFASKKGQGSTRNGRDSNPKYLGVKKYDGEEVKAGNIIVRQRGTKFHAGTNAGLGKDYTSYDLYANIIESHDNKKYTIEEARDIILENLSILRKRLYRCFEKSIF